MERSHLDCMMPNNITCEIIMHVASSHNVTTNSVTNNQATVEPTKPWPFLKQPLPMIILLSVAYIVVFLLGIVNNCLVISVIYRNNQLRTVTNYFIANLAVADILVCISVLPITLLNNVFKGKNMFTFLVTDM